MYGIWIWMRRLVVGGFAAMLAIGAVVAFRAGHWPGSACAAVASLFFGWIAVFGRGRSESPNDDRPMHRARVRRYRR